jgi:hypothetical protein
MKKETRQEKVGALSVEQDGRRLRLVSVARELEPELRHVAAKIRPLGQDVLPSGSFRRQTRLRLLELKRAASFWAA